MKILNFFKDREEEFTSLVTKLVSFSTYSGEVENINLFIDYLQDLFVHFNPRVTRIPTPAGDILSMKFFSGRNKRLVLLAHADTVKVSETPLPIRTENTRLYGNGSYDMKNGIALFYFVLQAVTQLDIEPENQLHIIINPDEEIGSKASKPHLLRLCKGAACVLLPEPCCPDGGVKVRRKGVASIEVELTGKAAHSGIEPEKGLDANRGLARLIQEIDGIVKHYSDLIFNPGIIEGGLRTNMVSPRSVLMGEFRSFSNEVLKNIAKDVERIEQTGEVEVKITCKIEQPALEFDDKNKKVYEAAFKCAEKYGCVLPNCSTGGGSDGSTLSAAGVAVLDGLGMRGAGSHSENEYIELPDFPFRAALITSLCMEI